MGGGGGGDGGAMERQFEEQRKEQMRGQINTLYDAPDATTRFGQEEQQLSEALRGYYSDQLGRSYADAERQARFGAANTGNIGGSAYADSIARVNRDNALGGTRIQEAVTRAINNLRTSREDTRNKSIGLVNSGSGSEAVNAAQSGLQQALSGANAANRENLTADLFQNLAFTKIAGDNSARESELLNAYRTGRPGSYFATQPSAGGTLVRY